MENKNFIKHIWGVYDATRRHDLDDLVFGLAHYQCEKNYPLTEEQDKAMRLFIGKHTRELANAFKKLSQNDFTAFCEQLWDKDNEEIK